MVKTANFYDRELDEVNAKIARRSIGETPESLAKGLQILKNKLISVEDLHSRLDDEFLLRFLRVAKFDANKAYDRVRKYYLVKKKYDNIFDKFYPSACQTALDAQHFLVSPKRAEDGSIVAIHKRGRYNPSTMSYEEMFRLDTVILDYLVENPITQMCGATIIMDFEGYSFQIFIQDTPKRMRMAIESFQNSFPLRFKTIHVVNAPAIFSLLYNLCYPFLTKKIRNRLHFHSSADNWQSLHDLVPPDVLPQKYGGNIPDSDIIDLSQEVIKRDGYFKEQLKYGYVSKKRSGFFY